MLFKIEGENQIKPVEFIDFADCKKLEKDLENLLAKYLLGTLFEQPSFLPFHQQRPRQGEGDIYALNAKGDVVIIELKRATAGRGSLDQLFRYVGIAGNWGYAEIERKFINYQKDKQDFESDNLREAHQNAFNLENPIEENEFNHKQHMWIVGSAADDNLIKTINFWKNKGLPIEFYPYRVYQINEQFYFEFFAKPNDVHVNPGKTKGVLFDTNRSWDPSSFESMFSESRVSAYGTRKNAVNSLSRGDLVFYSHKGVGIVGAAKITGNSVKNDGSEELYWDVEILTPFPNDFSSPKAMSFQDVQRVTGKSFFWARIQKVPYLTFEEAENFLDKLKEVLAS